MKIILCMYHTNIFIYAIQTMNIRQEEDTNNSIARINTKYKTKSV